MSRKQKKSIDNQPQVEKQSSMPSDRLVVDIDYNKLAEAITKALKKAEQTEPEQVESEQNPEKNRVHVAIKLIARTLFGKIPETDGRITIDGLFFQRGADCMSCIYGVLPCSDSLSFRKSRLVNNCSYFFKYMVDSFLHNVWSLLRNICGNIPLFSDRVSTEQ